MADKPKMELPRKLTDEEKASLRRQVDEAAEDLGIKTVPKKGDFTQKIRRSMEKYKSTLDRLK